MKMKNCTEAKKRNKNERKNEREREIEKKREPGGVLAGSI